jgi:hypothetical protein
MSGIALLLLALLAAPAAHASPLWLEVETGATFFKWNQETWTEENGLPGFGEPKWDFGASLKWAPASLQSRGFLFSAGFRYQALGWSKYSQKTFVDGPRLGISYRGRLVQ